MQFLHKLPPPLGNSNARFLTSFTSKPNIISLRCLSLLSLDCSTEEDSTQPTFFSPTTTTTGSQFTTAKTQPSLFLASRAASRGWILEKRPILRHDSVPPSLLKTPRDSSCDRCVERLDPSRINETNYEKILRLLCAEKIDERRENGSEGCARDHVTYNLLVCEFARGGVLKRLERMYQSLMSRKMTLDLVTLVSMLGAYAEFGVGEDGGDV
ncbi:Uncharacterized protein Rs2_45152 [Raphanus sativus]|nr:Uncharacterized protein Rs2_45152 [Raphanus sativus]